MSRNSHSDMTMGEAVVVILLAVTVATMIGLLVGSIFYNMGFSTGTGQRIGYISEVQNRGTIWHPTRITLINSEPTFSDTDTSYDFAPLNDDIKTKAIHYMNTHEKVVVTYEARQFTERWDFASRIIITGIELNRNNAGEVS